MNVSRWWEFPYTMPRTESFSLMEWRHFLHCATDECTYTLQQSTLNTSPFLINAFPWPFLLFVITEKGLYKSFWFCLNSLMNHSDQFVIFGPWWCYSFPWYFPEKHHQFLVNFHVFPRLFGIRTECFLFFFDGGAKTKIAI